MNTLEQHNSKHHVVFDLSRNISWRLPSNKHIKKSLASGKYHLHKSPASTGHDSSDDHTDSELAQLTRLSLANETQSPLKSFPSSFSQSSSPHSSSSSSSSTRKRSILKVSSNPHLAEEWENVQIQRTLNMRQSEIEARRREDFETVSSALAGSGFDTDSNCSSFVPGLLLESSSDSEHESVQYLNLNSDSDNCCLSSSVRQSSNDCNFLGNVEISCQSDEPNSIPPPPPPPGRSHRKRLGKKRKHGGKSKK